MRKKPIKTIHTRSWMARISLVLIFTLAIFMGQGLLGPNTAQAAHTLDTSAMAPAVQATNPATLSYTCGAGTTVLVVMIGHTNVARTGGAPTYNGIAMTQVGSEVIGAAEVGAEMWYLINPPTGAAYTISVPNTGLTNQRIYAISFKASSGNTSALDVSNSTNVDATNPSLGLTTTVNGDAVVDILADGNNSVPTARSHTLISNADEGAWVSEAQYNLQAAAGAITLSHTIVLENVAMIAAAFKDVASAGTLQFTSAAFSVNENVASINLTVSRTGGSSGAVSVQCADAGTGTATGGGTDYTFTSPQTLNWANGDLANKNCVVSVTNDTLDEANETVNALLQTVTGGATIGAQSTATLTITDDDPTPSLSINDVTLAEGNSGTTTFTFTVTLSAASGQTVTVDYATADGTATTAAGDYTGIGITTLTYTPGQTTKTINVMVNGDTNVEANETFSVNLSNATNATILDNQGLGTINNDDAAACTLNAPLVEVLEAPKTIITDNGNVAYNVRITNQDSGASCTNPLTINLSRGDSNTNFTSSIPASVSLAPGANATVALTVTEATAISGETTTTTVTASAAGHSNGTNNVVTTYNSLNPLLHNSAVTGSTKWAPNGWGTSAPGSRYGEFTCETCHVKSTTGVKRIRQTVTAPSSPAPDFPGGASSPVTFTDPREGTSDFGDDSTAHATSTKICEVCHTYDVTAPLDGVKWHAYNMSTGGADLTHNNKTDCTGCHKHNKGFKASCDTCHGNPPTVSTLGGPNGLANDPVATGSTTAGAHNTHVTTLGFSECNNCHNGYTAANQMPNNGDINIGFSNFGSTTGSYVGQNGVSYNGVVQGAADSKTCSTVYCHGSTITPVANPVWDLTVACGDCHKATNADPPTLGAHQRHAESGVYSVTKQGLNVACTDCHGATAGASGHVNGDVLWSLSTTNSRFKTSAPYATYNSLTTGSTGTRAPSGTYQTCNNIYCHSTVTTDGGTAGAYVASPAWNGSTTCASCHASQTSTYTGKHQTHATTYGYVCATCHSGAGSETTKHSDQVVDVSINATYGGTYAGTLAPGDAYSTCSSVYCHGNFTGGLNASPNWGLTAACGTCHKYLNTDPPTKESHPRHVGTAAGQKNLACTKCHPSRAALDGHVDSSVQWALDTADTTLFGGSATYSTGASGATGAKAPSASYGNCNNVYCHSTAQAGDGASAPTYKSQQWGVVAPLTCTAAGGCHDNPPATPTASAAHTTHTTAPVSLTCAGCHKNAGDETSLHADGNIDVNVTDYGAAATYSQSPNPPRNGFGYCQSTTCHGTGNSTRGWGVDLTSNDRCTACHGNMTAGADGSATAYKRAPGADGPVTGTGGGVDTAGQTGTYTSSVSDDAQVGAHNAHLLSSSNYSSDIACAECHAVPGTDAEMMAHFGALPADLTWGALAAANSATPGYASPNCTNTYCHFGKSIGGYSPATANASVSWVNGSYLTGTPSLAGDCGKCHLSPPATTGSHNGVTNINQCNGCHNHVTTTGTFSDATKHINGAVDAQGDCTGCHNSAQSDAANVDIDSDGVRTIVPEFSRTSHHVTGVALTKWHCIVCHAEGDSTGNPGALHKNGQIDLRNVDSSMASPTVYAWTGTQHSNIDSFCMSCHDANGANGTNVAALTGGTAQNPFNDTRANGYDQVVRTVVTNVYDQFNFGTGGSGTGYNGNASQHAVRGGRYSTTPATSLFTLNRFISTYTPLGAAATVRDTSLIHCGDCHTVGVWKTTGGIGAHGSANEYMLRTTSSSAQGGSGTDVEHIETTYVCFNCHGNTIDYTTSHVGGGNGSDFVDTTTGVGTAGRAASSGNITGMTCANCHNVGAIGWGGIHGGNTPYTDIAGTPNVYPYRFMPGMGNTRYAPGDWTTTTGPGCYTGPTANWGSCTKHSGGAKGPITRNQARPLKY